MQPFRFAIFLAVVTILAVVLVTPGCEQSHKKSQTNAAAPATLKSDSNAVAHNTNKPASATYRGTAVVHDLIFDNHGVWGQSTAASAGHDALLSWQGSASLNDGSAGTGFLQMEDGSNYTVIYAHPTSPAEQSAVPDTLKGFFSFPGSSGKVFTAKIGLLKGSTNAKVTFEIWASNDRGDIVLIKQYPKVYDGNIAQISVQFPQTSSASFKMQLRVVGSGSSIGSAAWIGPKVIVDQLNINDRPTRTGG